MMKLVTYSSYWFSSHDSCQDLDPLTSGALREVVLATAAADDCWDIVTRNPTVHYC